ncbi:MBL fold metallo-hydrolase [Colwelliaceae bacterium 6441]
MHDLLKRFVKKRMILHTLSFISILFITTVKAQTITTESFIERLKHHYKPINMMTHYSVTYKSTGKSPTQSYDYSHPDKTYRREIIDVDMSKKQYFSHLTRGGFPGGFVFNTKEFQTDNKRYRYDVNGVLWGKQVSELNTKFGYQLRVNDVTEAVDILAVKEMLNESTNKTKLTSKFDVMSNRVTIEKNSTLQGKLTYTFQVNPIRLLSHYNEKNGQKFSYSNPVHYNGIEYASKVLMEEAHFSSEILIENVVAINKIDAMKLMIPKGYGPIVNDQQLDLTTEMIGKDLYLISHVSDRYIAFKVDDSGIMVFGAPLSEKWSEKVIAHINKQFPNKKIESVYITHPHSDHIGGLAAYAKKGITILADPYSVEAIKAFPGFAKSIDSFTFRPFMHKEVINDVRFYIPDNAHAKGQSFAYFEDSKIIYEGDLLEIPFDNTIATYMSLVEKQFVEFVRAEQLIIKRIIGHHRNGNISPEVMNAYYQKNTQ